MGFFLVHQIFSKGAFFKRPFFPTRRATKTIKQPSYHAFGASSVFQKSTGQSFVWLVKQQNFEATERKKSWGFAGVALCI